MKAITFALISTLVILGLVSLSSTNNYNYNYNRNNYQQNFQRQQPRQWQQQQQRTHWSTGKSFVNRQNYNNYYNRPAVNNNNYNKNGNRQSPSFNNNFQSFNQISSRFPDYEFTGLQLINSYRRKHQTQGMSLDSGLVQRAQFCANYYATMGVINHSCQQTSGAGENLYMVYGSRKNSVRADDATRRAIDSWYSENRFYTDYNKNSFGLGGGAGHFTQLIWRGSQKIGVGVATVQGKTAVVVLFYPPGNYMGRFKNNVLPPSGK